MSLYAPRCAAMCDRSRHRRASSAAGTTPGVARGSAAKRVADSRRTDPVVHREQDRAALTDNHRGGVHDSRASPARLAWDDGRRAQRWLVRVRARPGSSAALICFLDRAQGPGRPVSDDRAERRWMVGAPGSAGPGWRRGGIRSWLPRGCRCAGRCWRGVGGCGGLGPVALVEQRGVGIERSRPRRAAASRQPSSRRGRRRHPRCRRFRRSRGAGLRPQRGRRSEAHHKSALGEPSHRRAGRRIGGSASRLTNTSAGNRELLREFHREQLWDVGVLPAATRWLAVGRVPWWRHVVVRPLWRADASGGTRADDPVGTRGTIMQVKAGRFFNLD